MARIVSSGGPPKAGEKGCVLQKIDEIEIFREDVYLISYVEGKKVSIHLGEHLGIDRVKDLLREHFRRLGRGQANGKDAITRGKALPWSRNLEGGEAAFSLDTMYPGVGEFSRALWEAFEEALPPRIGVESDGDGGWLLKERSAR